MCTLLLSNNVCVRVEGGVEGRLGALWDEGRNYSEILEKSNKSYGKSLF